MLSEQLRNRWRRELISASVGNLTRWSGPKASHDTVWDIPAPTILFPRIQLFFYFIVENISSVICNSFNTITSLSLQAVLLKLFFVSFFFPLVFLCLRFVSFSWRYYQIKFRKIKSKQKRDSEMKVDKRTI